MNDLKYYQILNNKGTRKCLTQQFRSGANQEKVIYCYALLVCKIVLILIVKVNIKIKTD